MRFETQNTELRTQNFVYLHAASKDKNADVA
jgi:hypothetical protein